MEHEESQILEDLRQRTLRLLDSNGLRLLQLMVRLTLRQEVAEDLFQDLLLKLMKSPTWALTLAPDRYVFRMAINLARKWRRAQRRRPTAQLPESCGAANPTPLQGLVEREEFERVLLALDDLPELVRYCLVFRYLEQETPEEIARQLGKSAHRVRSICSKGLSTLRKRLGWEREL